MDNLIDLANIILDRVAGRTRIIVAIAGPPGSGKSTLCEKLHDAVNRISHEDISVIVPMDGFHLENSELDKLGLRQRKGAPETFDSAGYVNLISELESNRHEISIPSFDRSRDRVIFDGKKVLGQQKIVFTEGNYLLINSPPWAELRKFFEISVFLDPGFDEIERRLITRWQEFGLSSAEAYERASNNDLPNARFVLEHSTAADFNFTSLN